MVNFQTTPLSPALIDTVSNTMSTRIKKVGFGRKDLQSPGAAISPLV